MNTQISKQNSLSTEQPINGTADISDTWVLEEALNAKTFFVEGVFLSDPFETSGTFGTSESYEIQRRLAGFTDEQITNSVTAQITEHIANKSLINRLAKLFFLLQHIADKEQTTLHTIASNPLPYIAKYGFAVATDKDRLFVIDEEGNIHYQNEWAYLNDLPNNLDGSIPQPNDTVDRYETTIDHTIKTFSENAKFLRPKNTASKQLYKQIELKANKFIWEIRIKLVYDMIMSDYNSKNAYSEEEKQTFTDQLAEAKSFIANTNTPTPLLDNIASIRGVDKKTLAQKIIGKHNKQIQFFAAANATKAKLLEQVAAAKDKESARDISLKSLKSLVQQI